MSNQDLVQKMSSDSHARMYAVPLAKARQVLAKARPKTA